MIGTLKNDEFYKDKLVRNEIIFYLDNSKAHNNKKFRNYCMRNKFKILYGVPYHCQYNLAELAFAKIKNQFYKYKFKNRYISL